MTKYSTINTYSVSLPTRIWWFNFRWIGTHWTSPSVAPSEGTLRDRKSRSLQFWNPCRVTQPFRD